MARLGRLRPAAWCGSRRHKEAGTSSPDRETSGLGATTSPNRVASCALRYSPATLSSPVYGGGIERSETEGGEPPRLKSRTSSLHHFVVPLPRERGRTVRS